MNDKNIKSPLDTRILSLVGKKLVGVKAPGLTNRQYEFIFQDESGAEISLLLDLKTTNYYC